MQEQTSKSADHNKVQKSYKYISESINDKSGISSHWEMNILLNK